MYGYILFWPYYKCEGRIENAARADILPKLNCLPLTVIQYDAANIGTRF
jgi:hypothetical protein